MPDDRDITERLEDPSYDDCLDAIKKMGNCPMTLAMQNHKVLGSSLTVLDWVRATLLDLEVEINARKNTAEKRT